MDATWKEQPVRPAEDRRLLIYVLHYDDLLAGGTQVFELDRALAIGRAYDELPSGIRAPGELRLRDHWMSGGHARIDRRGDHDVLRDLGSSNGSFVNCERVAERALEDGDLVEVGHSLFVYRVVDGELAGSIDARRGRAIGPTRTFCAELSATLEALDRIAAAPEAVLVLGESGTGKEVVARLVHEASRRRGELRAIDCGAVPDNLFESTLFGHRRGAFTGADEARTGEVERAHRGTLFLDEVGNLSSAAQAKLLRVIEQGEVTPVGGADPVRVDVRWVAATNRALFGDDGFRADLLRRLAAFVVQLPPLRERREDLGELTRHILREAGVARAAITVAAAREVFAAPLPGNVRQLRTTLRTAATLAGDAAIDVKHLPIEPEAPRAPVAPPAPAPRPTGKPTRDDVDAALTATRGNVVHAAAMLGTHPRHIYRLIEKLGLSLDRYRA